MTDTPTPGAAAELPTVAFRRFSHITGWNVWEQEGLLPGPNVAEALTPHAPAQAQLDALREEVARLNSIAPTSRAGAVLGQMKSELDEARLEVARLTKERDEAREDIRKLVRRVPELAGETQRLHTELAALKAQPTDVDALMTLAETCPACTSNNVFASLRDAGMRWCGHCNNEWDAREALRAKLAARKEPT